MSSRKIQKEIKKTKNYLISVDNRLIPCYTNLTKNKEVLKMKWTDFLSQEVYERLCACNTLKSDIPQLVNSKWKLYQETGKDKNGFTKEDALVSVLELLDCNSQSFDLTKDEYNEFIR